MHQIVVPEKSTITSRVSRQGADFLRIEIQTGLTLAHIASCGEPDSERRSRNQANAVKAYQTVLRFRYRLQNLDQAVARDIHNGLARLRSALQELGEDLDSGW